MKNAYLVMSLLFVGLLSSQTYAEPTTAPTFITQIRPYVFEDQNQKGHVLITVESSNQCGTTNFKLNLNNPGSKEAYAAALAALMSKTKVRLEILNSSGCSGDWTTLQSITVSPYY